MFFVTQNFLDLKNVLGPNIFEAIDSNFFLNLIIFCILFFLSNLTFGSKNVFEN